MTEHFDAWQCIGCGGLEASRPCLGVCQDKRVKLVSLEDYEGAMERARVAEAALRFAHTQPRSGRWRESFLAFKQAAAALVAQAGALEDALAERNMA